MFGKSKYSFKSYKKELGPQIRNAQKQDEQPSSAIAKNADPCPSAPERFNRSQNATNYSTRSLSIEKLRVEE